MEMVPFCSSCFSKKMEEKLRLQRAFESAQTSQEMVKALEEIEKEGAFTDIQIGVACYRIAHKLHHQDKDHQKALTFILRAFLPSYSSQFPPLSKAKLLKLKGSIHFHMKRFGVSLLYFEAANEILCSFLGPSFSRFLVAQVLPVYLDVLILQAKAHQMLLNLDKALVFCLKALNIQEKRQGNNNNNSKVVAMLRNFLGILYSESKEHDKALEQFAMANRIYKDLDLKSDLLRCEIDVALAMIALRRYDEAVGTLKNVLQQTEKNWKIHALALIALAKASCDQENFVDCRNYLLDSLGVLDQREEESPVDVALVYSKICEQCESMHEFETAISLLKRTLILIKMLPYKKHFVGKVRAKLGSLLLQTGKVDDAITYAKSAIELLVYSMSSRNIRMAYNYNTLGLAYLKSGEPQSAVQMFSATKDIMDASLPLDHVDTIEVCQHLSKAYGEIKSYGLAIDYQQQVISGWESHGASGEDGLREARQLLKELKKKASGFYANESPENTLP